MPVTREELGAQLRDQWPAFAERALEASSKLLDESEMGPADVPQFQVNLVAMALLCRSVNHFAAFRNLMEQEFIVEARTIGRCCWENLFWIGGLKTQGVAFLDKMEMAHAVSELKVGKDLLAYAKKHGGEVQGQEELEAFLDELAKTTDKKVKIVQQQEAQAAGMGDGYTVYRMLSRDAAHPSIPTVTRHLRANVEEGSITIIGPSRWSDDDEDLETWELASTAFVTTLLHVRDILGAPKIEEVEKAAAEHMILNGVSAKHRVKKPGMALDPLIRGL